MSDLLARAIAALNDHASLTIAIAALMLLALVLDLVQLVLLLAIRRATKKKPRASRAKKCRANARDEAAALESPNGIAAGGPDPSTSEGPAAVVERVSRPAARRRVAATPVEGRDRPERRP